MGMMDPRLQCESGSQSARRAAPRRARARARNVSLALSQNSPGGAPTHNAHAHTHTHTHTHTTGCTTPHVTPSDGNPQPVWDCKRAPTCGSLEETIL